MGKFDLPFVPMTIKNFKDGYYWVSFDKAFDKATVWEVAWLRLDTTHGGIEARSVLDYRPRILKPGFDTVGHKIEHEAPIVIPETKQLAEDAEFLLSLTPAWARHSEPGMHTTMYGTGSYEKDSAIVDRVKKIKESIEVTLYGKAEEKG